MGLPPAEPGDEFDFEQMTPEEQLAWLESLAKRQGASEDELITAADLDVPVPENVEIDEPGYVPYSILHDGHVAVPEVAEEATQRHASRDEFEEAPRGEEELWPVGSTEPEAEAVPVEEEQEEPVAPVAADPMRWLQGLSVQPDEDTVVHVRAEEGDSFSWSEPDEEAAAEPAFSLAEGDFGAAGVSSDEPGEAGFPADREPEIPAVHEQRGSEDADFLDGVDPMLWLESLAARQGAKSEELVTAADLSIEQPPEDTVIDEPGYVPFEASRMSLGLVRGLADEEAQTPDFAGWDEESEVFASEKEASWEEPAGAAYDTLEPQELAAGDEGVASLDSGGTFDWLASLDRRAEAAPDELAAPGIAPEGVAGPVLPAAEGEAVPDALLWLEDLATEPDSDLSEYLAVDEGDAQAARQPGLAGLEHADPLAGMTDEEIEQALARGELSGEQELAWLKRQATRLAAARDAGEGIDSSGIVEAEPASPSAELPPWIAEMRPLEEISETEAAALLDLESAEPEVPSWWAGMAEVDEAAEPAEPEGGPLVAEQEPLAAEAAGVEESDLGLPALDLPSEVVDESYTGSEQASEDAYGEVSAVEAEGAEPVAEPVVEGEEGEPVLQQAVPVDMPAWLLDEEEIETPAFQDADAPAWLRDVADRETPAAEEHVWLESPLEVEAPEAEADADWLREFDRGAVAELRWEEAAPPPEVSPAREEPAAVARSRRALFPPPDSEQLAAYRQRLAEAPEDHANRIALARALWALDEVQDSFAQYEALIETGQYLPDVVNDLSAFVEDHPGETRIHRMLGDAYLRRGRLKEALYSYRKALEQL